MTDKKPSELAAERRKARQEELLKANLRRRKEQARARRSRPEETETETGEGPGDGGKETSE